MFKLPGGLEGYTCPDIDNIINLANNFQLTKPQIEILSKGLTFIPTPLKFDKPLFMKDLHFYHRRLKLLDFFNYVNTGTPTPFQLPSSWVPAEDQISPLIKQLCDRDYELLSHIDISSRPPARQNITTEQRSALKQLANNELVVLKPADKGSVIVILDRAQYLLEAERQLMVTQHYRPLSHSIKAATQELQRPILDQLKNQGFITAKQHRFLEGPDEPRDRLFYLLPKVHKKPESWPIPGIPPGRPIISDCGSESYQIAKYIDSFLNPISQCHSSYLKDTYDFISKLQTIQVPQNTFLFTVDITSLYTNIDTDLGLQAVKEAFQRHPDINRPDDAILQLLHLGLTRNDFSFNGNYYLQIHGTAMGKTFAPSYANIYMADWENGVFKKCSKKPLIYYRYLDDIFGLWSFGEAAFQEFVNVMNNHHKTIKVTSNIQPDKIEFLDTEVFFVERESSKHLATRVFFKNTDTHALLHKSSYHPKHTFRGIVKSQLIRFRRICTFECDVEQATLTLFAALRKRGYSRRFLRSIKAQVRFSFQTPLQDNMPTRNDSNLLPFVQTFHQRAANWNRQIRENFVQLQNQTPQLQDFHLISAYRRNKNLKDVLIRTRFDRPPREKGPFLTLHFLTNSLTGKGAPIMCQIQPDTSNVIYAIKCMSCHILYIGETKSSMRIRLKQHLYYIRIKKDRILYNHFQMHSIEHLRIIGLQSDLSWSKEQRLRLERNWMLKLNTISPWGLNEKW